MRLVNGGSLFRGRSQERDFAPGRFDRDNLVSEGHLRDAAGHLEEVSLPGPWVA